MAAPSRWSEAACAVETGMRGHRGKRARPISRWRRDQSLAVEAVLTCRRHEPPVAFAGDPALAPREL
jgi:hypothetical protein